MTRLLASALLLSLGFGMSACSARSVTPAPPRPEGEIPFLISTLGERWTVEVEFEGTARVVDDRLEIVVPRAVVRSPVADPRFRPGALQFGLAFAIPEGGWDVRRRSNDIAIASVLPPGSTLAKDTLRFTIALPPTLNLSRHWLVVTASGTRQEDDGRFARGFSHAHSRRDLFSRPFPGVTPP